MKNRKYIFLILAVLLVTLVGLGLRVYAVENLYIDYDEPIYLRAALEYTNYIREGKANWIIWTETNYEHPSFYKVFYGVTLLNNTPLKTLWDDDFVDLTPMKDSPAKEWGMTGRWVSLVFGSLTVFALALINPLAGLFLAINSISVKYTSQFYLEALPFLTSFLAVVAYGVFFKTFQQHPEKKKRALLWLAVSAVCLGVTAASKYLYCAAGLAIVAHWLIAAIRKQLPSRSIIFMLGWGAASLLVFFACDFYLWPHPLSRLLKTLSYHAAYPGTENVKEYGYPIWQPVLWLMNPFKYFDPMKPAAFLVYLDPLIFSLAVFGLPRTFKRQNLYFIWLIIGLIVLLAWGTKWPQYVMIVLVPFCMAASQGFLTIYDIFRQLWRKLNFKKPINKAV